MNLMTNDEYSKYVDKKSPNSKLFSNMFKAFIVGGAICIIGQLITNLLLNSGYDKNTVASLTPMAMIFLGAFFTGLNVYDDLGRFAGAGSIVPITGFANSIVAPAMEYKSEGFVMGVGAKMFTIAGPVIVYGVIASIFAGILHFLII